MYVNFFYLFFEKAKYMRYFVTEANVIIDQLMEEHNNEENSSLRLSGYAIFICSSI